MPDRDEPLDLLRELRDVGITPPPAAELRARVASAITEEIERENQPQRRDFNGGSPHRSRAQRVGGPRRRPGFGRLARGLVPAVGVLVVVLVVVLFVGLRGSGPSTTAPGHGPVAPGRGSVKLVYMAEPTALVPHVTTRALERTVQVMQAQVRALGIRSGRLSLSGANEITVVLPDARNTAQAELELGSTAQLLFYDWEANALTPDGKAAATHLQTQDPDAIEISQGSGPLPAGAPGAGSMALYQAVRLAARQPRWSSSANSRITPQYWMFGAPGSAACATAAREEATVPVAGEHCLLAGPEDSVEELDSGLPAGVRSSQGQVLSVPRGWVVLEAIASSFAHPVPVASPNAQFFVLKDDVALRTADITNPQQGTDPNTGTPDITFGFSSKGKSEFQNLTATIARRGALVSGLGQTLNQHFAIALDNQLISVPYIDYKAYPDGITGDDGADLTSGFTVASAHSLAADLQVGALPLSLKLVCVSAPAGPCHSPARP